MIVDAKTTTKQFIQKMKLIANVHENVLLNVRHVRQKQKKTYAIEEENKPLRGWLLDKQWLR